MQGEREKIIGFSKAMGAFLKKLTAMLNEHGQPYHITFNLPSLPQLGLTHSPIRFHNFVDSLGEEGDRLESMV